MKKYIIGGVILLIIILALLFGKRSAPPQVTCDGHYVIMDLGSCPTECGFRGSSRTETYKWISQTSGATGCPASTSTSDIPDGCMPTQPCLQV